MTATRPTDTVTRPGDAPGADGPVATAWRAALPVGEAIDPWSLAGGDDTILLAEGGRVLVGLDTALRLDLPGGLDDSGSIDRVTRQLAAIGCDDRLATGTTPLRAVLAFGALPFERDRPATLVVPTTLYCREPDGSEWVTVVTGPDDHPDVDPRRVRARLAAQRRWRARRAAPDSWRIVPRDGDAGFEDRVAEAVAAIGRGEVDKVVLAAGWRSPATGYPTWPVCSGAGPPSSPTARSSPSPPRAGGSSGPAPSSSSTVGGPR